MKVERHSRADHTEHLSNHRRLQRPACYDEATPSVLLYLSHHPHHSNHC